MRILHVTDAASGGVLTSATALAAAEAAEPGVESVLFAYTPRHDSPDHDEISRLVAPATAVRWAHSPRRAIPGLVSHINREMRSGGWDVTHLHSSRAGFLGRMLAKVHGLETSVVYSPHCFSFTQARFSQAAVAVFLGLERLALRGGSSLVLVSDSEADIARAKLPGVRAAVLPNTVDTDALRPSAPTVDTAPLRIVHVGRVMPQKRPELFAEIAKTMDRDHPGRFEFTWIGDGDRALLGDAQVTVTGWLSPAETRERLSAAAGVLFTSAVEGMPMAILEASSLGVPTIGSDVDGVRDLITSGEDGMLFDSVGGAVAALLDLGDAERRSRFADAARRRVLAAHSRKGLGARALAIYGELTDAAPLSPEAVPSAPNQPKDETASQTVVATEEGRSL